jgi:DNA-binding transcriptional LysR family regulator
MNMAQPTVTKHVAELERVLNTRLFNRNTRNVTPTEAGLLYYEKCRGALHELDDAADLVRGGKTEVGGLLRVSTSIAFGRRVLTPLILDFMAQHPNLRVDFSCDDRYVDLVSQGIDCAVRLGRLSDSSYGARFLGVNPWVMVATPGYLRKAGQPATPHELAQHDCLVYSTVAGADTWRLTGKDGTTTAVSVNGRMRSNNLTSLLEAVRAGLGIAILPYYVADEALEAGAVRQVLAEYDLPAQDIHMVLPSPKLVPRKVATFASFLQRRLQDRWWRDLGRAPLIASAAE